MIIFTFCILTFVFTFQVCRTAGGLVMKAMEFLRRKKEFFAAATTGITFFLIVVLISGDLFFGSCALGAGVFVPGIIRKVKRGKEEELFESQLCDCLFVISSSVKAGANLAQALENAAAGSQPPFSKGLTEALAQVRLGVPLGEALIKFDERSKVPELHLAVVAVNAAREYGGNLSENLFKIATTLRERKRMKDRMRAATAQGRLSAITITAMPFLLVAVLSFMEPGIFGVLTRNFYGKLILLAAALMSAAGNYFIMKIVKIKM